MPKLLVIDDEPMARLILKTLFEADGYEILEAADAVEGLQFARQHKPQLIVTDLHMSQMNGLEFLAKLKSDPSIKDIPVIISSARSSAEVQKTCLEAGALQYVPKPVDLIAFRKRVKELLDRPA